ncbi:leucyl/phenylalanyl-tRNA--protein transferase [Aeromicrobium sp. Leaf350]|uniref:leucyl/phenylalanyl-tRNA--protein transferase n=1 Tax=Aeromicrobium sp. Leaf350 TaxID=2876565 RepID=UPI001E312119|nr:leucyl/phenylalanyl-tRNA--protein transferase [Aeromicrobium sp. Leaf350]
MTEPQPLPPSPWQFPEPGDPVELPPVDCVVGGADLEPSTVVAAYRAALFPMGDDGGAPLWWSPMQRGILWPEQLHVSRSLRRAMGRFTTTVDTAFEDVIDACADPSRPGAWIDEPIREAYVRLHELGWAHSVEVWSEDQLVGGLYGLEIGDLFAGESMFHRATDASKIALVELCRRMAGGLVDVQWRTDHLATLGVVEVPREEYRQLVVRHRDRRSPDRWT